VPTPTTPAHVGAETKKGLHGPERRQSLIDTAWSLLAQGGPKAVTIDSIVTALGITRPIFYRHFSDRVDLLVALYRQYADQMARRQQAIIFGHSGSLEELLRVTLLDYFDIVAEHGAAIRPLIEAALDDPRMASERALLRERMLTMWESAVSRHAGEELRRLVVSDPGLRVALGTLIEMLLAAVVEGATMWLSRRAPRDLVEDVVGVLVEGVAERLERYLAAARRA
jgi:AcrR family transcriptional regulator